MDRPQAIAAPWQIRGRSAQLRSICMRSICMLSISLQSIAAEAHRCRLHAGGLTLLSIWKYTPVVTSALR